MNCELLEPRSGCANGNYNICCKPKGGGVGKTTTAISSASSLAAFGQKVLLVDLDPQANSTMGLGINHAPLSKTIYDCLIDD